MVSRCIWQPCRIVVRGENKLNRAEMQIFPRGAGPRKTAAAGEYKSPAKLLFAFLPLFNRDGRIAAVAETSRAGLFRVALTFNSPMTQFLISSHKVYITPPRKLLPIKPHISMRDMDFQSRLHGLVSTSNFVLSLITVEKCIITSVSDCYVIAGYASPTE